MEVPELAALRTFDGAANRSCSPDCEDEVLLMVTGEDGPTILAGLGESPEVIVE